MSNLPSIEITTVEQKIASLEREREHWWNAGDSTRYKAAGVLLESLQRYLEALRMPVLVPEF